MSRALNTREHGISADLPASLRRQALLRAGIMAACAVPAGLLLGSKGDTPPAVVGLSALMMSVALGSGIFIGLRRQLAMWRSFRVLLSEDTITRYIAGFDDLTLHRDEISAIRELPGHGLAIVTRNHHRQIFVPEKLDGFGEVSATLSSWMPFVKKQPLRLAVLVAPVTSAVTVGLLVATMKAHDGRVVVPAGSVVVLGLGAMLIYLWKSPQVARWAKVYFLLLLPMVVGVAYRVWTFL
jgi:hypothetical protein